MKPTDYRKNKRNTKTINEFVEFERSSLKASREESECGQSCQVCRESPNILIHTMDGDGNEDFICEPCIRGLAKFIR